MRIAISHLHDRQPVRHLVATESVVVGTAESCDLVVDDPQASPTHARITFDRDGMLVVDLGSRAGTHIDGERVNGMARASSTSVILIGETILRIVGAKVVNRGHAGRTGPQSAIERDLLQQLRDQPASVDTRLVYADWLEEQQEYVKAEYVRSTIDHQLAPPSLTYTLFTDWRALVSRGQIHRCNHAGECPKRWEALAVTDRAKVRHCNACAKSIAFCDDPVEVRAHGMRAHQPSPIVLCRSLEQGSSLAAYDETHNRGYILGRPARVAGRPRLPLVATSASSHPTLVPELASLSSQLRGRLAVAWTIAARMEHASIAAFANLSIQLLALGAPPDLVAETHRAALDEIEHARLSFELASAYAGSPVRAGEFRDATRLTATGSLRALAIETFTDGCIGETAAALEAARAAELAQDPIVAGVLRQIAVDESRHAELAWATVAWCMREVGAVVLADLTGAVPATPSFADRTEGLAIHGVLDRTAVVDVYAEAVRTVTGRLKRLATEGPDSLQVSAIS